MQCGEEKRDTFGVWRRRKRHIWHYNYMLFATNYKNVMTYQLANNVVGLIQTTDSHYRQKYIKAIKRNGCE